MITNTDVSVISIIIKIITWFVKKLKEKDMNLFRITTEAEMLRWKPRFCGVLLLKHSMNFNPLVRSHSCLRPSQSVTYAKKQRQNNPGGLRIYITSESDNLQLKRHQKKDYT